MTTTTAEGHSHDIPSWYCPFKLEPNLLVPFQPLVFLTGLDVNGNQVHRAIWDTLNYNQANKDFQPSYMTTTFDHRFPFKQTKAENFDGYIPSPKGILRSNWITKHTQEIPSAVVVFFDMNWSDPQWNDRKLELAKTVKDLRLQLIPHGVQILVMLVKPMGVLDENFSTERASALCAAADIPPKYLFVLSHTHLERIQACIQRLEIGMRELAKIYYTARIKKVKSWKDKSTQTPLLVRYNFKIAFFQEIRKDYVTALSHYQAATDALLSIKMTDANIQELKVVASVINYRVCRIHLLKLDAKECKTQFDKHIKSFYKLEGNQNLLFEHLAWLESQYHTYGELLKQYYRPSHNFPDPITYFLMAAQYAEKRKGFYMEKVQPIAAALNWPSELEQFKGEVSLLYMGQRPWRPDGFGLDNLYTIEDPRAIAALQCLESLTKHSELIIFHLGIASDFCQKLQRGRTRCQLMSLMGAEFLNAKEYSKCIMLMTHILREFGNGDWKHIVYQVADCGLKAACCEGDIPAYCNFIITLLKLDLNQFVSKERRQLLWSKFQSVIAGKKPIPEENYVMKSSKWESGLDLFTSYVEVHKEPIINCEVFCKSDVVYVGSSVQIKFIITNKNEFPVSIRKYGIRTNIVDYKCEMDTTVTLENDETQELELALKPHSTDVTKVLLIQVAYLDIGKEKRSVLMHYTVPGAFGPYLWDNEWNKEPRHSLIKIEPTQPLLNVKLTHKPIVLLHEWHKVSITWENSDNATNNKLSLGCQLTAADPQKAILTTDPSATQELGSVTHTFELSQLEASTNHELIAYIKCTSADETEVKLLVKGRYFDGLNQLMTIEHTETLEVVVPFQINQSITNLQMEKLESISIDEEFMLHFVITNISKCSLKLENWKLVSNANNFKVKDINHEMFQKGAIILRESEEASLTCLVVPTTSIEPAMGHFEVYWKRDESDSLTSMTDVPVMPLTFSDSPLYLRAKFSENGLGKLKQPMTANYTLFNRTSKVHDITVSMDSSAESFMNAGPKKVSMKLCGKDFIEFSYVLFPLRTGLLHAPKLVIESTPNGTTILEPVVLNVHKDSPSSIFISP